MATFFQLWNDESNNLIDEFDSEVEAFDELRWRLAVGGEEAVRHLSLLRYHDPQTPEAVALGDELLRRAQEATAAHPVAD